MIPMLGSLLLAMAAAAPASSFDMSFNCAAPAPGSETPNLHGEWDVLMNVGGEPSFGVMSIGFVGSDYGGSLVPVRTAPVVIREVKLTGHKVHMVVASREGDVLFDGTMAAKGNRICGTVTYHRGGTFPMIAHKRPSSYRSASQAERAQEAAAH